MDIDDSHHLYNLLHNLNYVNIVLLHKLTNLV